MKLCTSDKKRSHLNQKLLIKGVVLAVFDTVALKVLCYGGIQKACIQSSSLDYAFSKLAFFKTVVG